MAYKYGIDTIYLQDGSKLTFDLETITIPPPENTSQINIDNYNVYIIKSGKIAMLCTGISGTLEAYGGWYNLGCIPERFRPAARVFRASHTHEGNVYIIFQIHTDGTLYIHNFGKQVTGDFFVDTITYLCT